MLLYNSSSPLPFFLAVCSSYAKNCKYAPHKRLLVVTCIGVWVVTVGSVPCLGNSQVITKSGLKFVSSAPISCCLWWLVSCRGRKPTLRLRPTLLHKSLQAAADKGKFRQMVKGKCLKYYGIVGEKFLCITDLYFSMSFFSLWANVSTKHVSLHSLHKEALYGCCCFSFFLFSTAKEEQSRGIFGGNFQTRARDCNKAAGP